MRDNSSEVDRLQRRIAELEGEVRELRATGTILRRIVDTNPNHLFLKDSKGRFIFVNQATADVYNLNPSELIGTLESDHNPDKEEVERFHAEDQQVLKSGQAMMIAEEQRTNPETGNSKWVQTVKIPLRLPGNSEPYVLGVSTDITERKLTELLLGETEERYKRFFNDAPVMYIVTRRVNGHPIIEDCNTLFCETMCYDRCEIVGRKVADFYTPASRRLLKDGYEAALRGEFQVDERQLFTGDNRIVDTLLNAIPTPGNDPSVESTLAMYVDISEQKSLEKQLRQAQKMEAIGTLAGGIAHDFNNILSAILGYTELNLQDLEKDSEFFANSEKIYQGALRARDLVRQILIFSHQKEYEYRRTRIDIVVKEALKLLRATLPSTIAIRQSIERNCCLVKADATQIHQVVMNLCTNSFHAMQRHGGQLSISLKRLPKDAAPEHLHQENPSAESYLYLKISDTGSGISPDILDRIFEPFFTTKKIGEGTGMGLAVVHGIIKRHNGAIEISSVENEGTSVEIYLPASSEEIRAAGYPKEQIAGGNEHILLVDDEEAIVRAGSRMLERLGYRVTTCGDSVQALEIFRARAGEFDLVLTDQTMPNLTGLQLAEAIQAIRPAIPIVLMSGFNDFVSSNHSASNGVRVYLDKPVRMVDISQAVRRALGHEESDTAIV